MGALRRRMIEDMQLKGLSEHTQRSYLYAVTSLARHWGLPPDQISEEKLRQFFLYLINKKRLTGSAVRVNICAIKFFYEKTLKRQWRIFDLIRPNKRKKLPAVLTPEEVLRLLAAVRRPIQRMCLTMIYSCGLRISEATHLEATDIDSHRMLVRIRNGKGGYDRYVPLPYRTLERLRAYWAIERPPLWLFPSTDPKTPLCTRTLQRTVKRALRQSGINKDVSVHTLRHSYATLLLENGVGLRVIQELLGHKSPRTTAIYTHLTQKHIENLSATINRLMADL